ncbi:hypothetical protein [Virgibacillus ihumii]|uniref:hypothetical protein n=1 Tax=Virgibacillus ihumii TaxID=2686091 RepID=UPI00157BE5C5|nr:hypothetical protein [Virgibacillus ihumii]
MDEELQQLTQDFIILPFVLKIFEQDKKHFQRYSSLESLNVFLSMLDAAIQEVINDLSATKQQLYTKHHIVIKRTGNTVYQWYDENQSGTIRYTPNKMQQLTKETMVKYIRKVKNFKMTHEGWRFD